MSVSFQSFHAKILLFGEYAILYGAKALAVPCSDYYSQLQLDDNQFPEKEFSNRNLRIFTEYLARNCSEFINCNQLQHDVELGLYLHSTIPKGYGLGSSGALVAAVFDAYTSLKKDDITLEKYHFYLQKMENAFHGNSSGIDPLVSFTNKNILLQDSVIEDILIKENAIKSSLIDSKRPRNTKHFVTIFKEKMKDELFKKKFLTKYITTNNQLIEAYLQSDWALFEIMLLEISYLQFEMFQEMITGNMIDKWKEGLSTKNNVLKLCGAGGGGMYLQFHFY